MEDNKKYDNWIKMLSILVVAIIVFVFIFTVSNTNLAKGTYSAGSTTIIDDGGSGSGERVCGCYIGNGLQTFYSENGSCDKYAGYTKLSNSACSGVYGNCFCFNNEQACGTPDHTVPNVAQELCTLNRICSGYSSYGFGTDTPDCPKDEEKTTVNCGCYCKNGSCVTVTGEAEGKTASSIARANTVCNSNKDDYVKNGYQRYGTGYTCSDSNSDTSPDDSRKTCYCYKCDTNTGSWNVVSENQTTEGECDCGDDEYRSFGQEVDKPGWCINENDEVVTVNCGCFCKDNQCTTVTAEGKNSYSAKLQCASKKTNLLLGGYSLQSAEESCLSSIETVTINCGCYCKDGNCTTVTGKGFNKDFATAICEMNATAKKVDGYEKNGSANTCSGSDTGNQNGGNSNGGNSNGGNSNGGNSNGGNSNGGNSNGGNSNGGNSNGGNSNDGNSNDGNPSTVDNPQTGTVGIIIAWVVGLSAIVYSLWYFKKSSSIN